MFVPVQPFSLIIPIEKEVGNYNNSTWSNISQEGEGAANKPIAEIVGWLLANAKGGYREWVDILRREPSLDGYQKIIGLAGYRFRDPEDALRFREFVGEKG